MLCKTTEPISQKGSTLLELLSPEKVNRPYLGSTLEMHIVAQGKRALPMSLAFPNLVRINPDLTCLLTFRYLQPVFEKNNPISVRGLCLT